VIDSALNFKYYLELLSSRTRKLMYVFKNLRQIAEKSTVKLVYLSLCQSILAYCITVWGGSSKTSLIKLERAQRAVLKVGYFKPFLYPTKDLYSLTDVLSVRQLFILNTVLKQHSIINYDPSVNANKRRKHTVCHPITQCSTTFSRRFFGYLGSFLYNKINRALDIYPLSKHQCRKTLTNWLKSFDYDETEKLLTVPS
jgi:hypothetical protein